MLQYQTLLDHILVHGTPKSDRTGTGTLSVFGYQMRFDLEAGFPLVTTKKLHFKSIVYELLWFLSGDTNIAALVRNGVHIWNEWPFQHWLEATGSAAACPKYGTEWKNRLQEFVERIRFDDSFAAEWGNLGPVYGKQWRNFNGVDQMEGLVRDIRNNPDSRRLVVTAWNPSDIPAMVKAGLPPCHALFQFYVAEGKLSCQLYQRSADVFLGVPFNIASYALLTMMIAQACQLRPGEFIHTFGDAHLYLNHLDQARTQIARSPRPLPIVQLNPAVKDLFSFTFEDIQLIGYDPWPHIPAQVSV